MNQASSGPEWVKVCQSSSCMYRANPAVDVWTREPNIRYYLCAECSIALGSRLKALHYHWSKLPAIENGWTTTPKEYEHGGTGLEDDTDVHRPANKSG